MTHGRVSDKLTNRHTILSLYYYKLRVMRKQVGIQLDLYMASSIFLKDVDPIFHIFQSKQFKVCFVYKEVC